MLRFPQLIVLGSLIVLLGGIWPEVAAPAQMYHTPGLLFGSPGLRSGPAGRRGTPRVPPAGTPVVPPACGAFQVVSSPNAGTANNALNAVAGVATTDIWAVGYYANNGVNQTLIEHWDGTSWSVVSSPNPGSVANVVLGVVALASNDVWASGQYNSGSGYQTLTMHWDGKTWSAVTNPGAGAAGASVDSLSALSSANIWGVGETASTSNVSQTFTEQWNGTSWNIVSSPNVVPQFNFLGGVAAVNGFNIWAVGSYTAGHGAPNYTLIEHWDGTSWSVVSSPSPGSFINYLTDVAASSASDVVAVGYMENTGGPVQTLVEQLTGAGWVAVASPNVGSAYNVLNRVTVISPFTAGRQCWTVGYYYNTGGVSQTLIEQG